MKKASATSRIALCSASSGVRRPEVSARSRHTRTPADAPSAIESRPNPINATDPAAMPAAIPTTASSAL
jgi:hypothetical protein